MSKNLRYSLQKFSPSIMVHMSSRHDWGREDLCGIHKGFRGYKACNSMQIVHDIIMESVNLLKCIIFIYVKLAEGAKNAIQYKNAVRKKYLRYETITAIATPSGRIQSRVSRSYPFQWVWFTLSHTHWTWTRVCFPQMFPSSGCIMK